jgi:DNA-directed RNA polymerase specialized sigma24 family protein
MARVCAGDQDAVRELLEEYGAFLLHVIRRKLSAELRAQFDSADFTQAVWASFLTGPLQDYHFDSPEELLRFLIGLARHKVCDLTRQRLQQKRNARTTHSLDGSAAFLTETLRDPEPTPSQVTLAGDLAGDQWDRLLGEEGGEVWEDVEPTPWPVPGEVFLGFELVRELGRGGFSRVFLAREPALGRRWVAVNVSQLGDTEAAILGRVPHPNIVPVHSADVDEGSGLAAVCMPYLGRATLADVCARVAGRTTLPRRARFLLDAVQEAAPPGGEEEPAPPDPALRRGDYAAGVLHLGAQVAEALAFIHGRGIYHRDLKPSNVLLTPGGRPMLLDFNLSFDERRGGGWLGGTLPYMPPEELRAITAPGGAAIDARSDLYALGVILYQLLAGRHPFGVLPPDGGPRSCAPSCCAARLPAPSRCGGRTRTWTPPWPGSSSAAWPSTRRRGRRAQPRWLGPCGGPAPPGAGPAAGSPAAPPSPPS